MELREGCGQAMRIAGLEMQHAGGVVPFVFIMAESHGRVDLNDMACGIRIGRIGGQNALDGASFQGPRCAGVGHIDALSGETAFMAWALKLIDVEVPIDGAADVGAGGAERDQCRAVGVCVAVYVAVCVTVCVAVIAHDPYAVRLFVLVVYAGLVEL